MDFPPSHRSIPTMDKKKTDPASLFSIISSYIPENLLK
jgi:hypothetical protein